MPYIAGVDAHKDKHSVVFLDSVGKIVKSLKICTNAAGYEEALALARSLNGEVVWGLESTGCYASALARVLIASGAVVYEVPGSFTKRHRQRSSRTGSQTHSTLRRSPKQSYVKHIAFPDVRRPRNERR